MRTHTPRKFLGFVFDKHLFFLVLGLLIFGVVMVANASVVDATKYFNDGFFYAKRQLVWAALGVVAMLITSQINYKIWLKGAIPLLVTTVVLLIMTLLPGFGISAFGAKRWVGFGPLIIQPAELAKFSLVLYSSRLFSKKGQLLPFLFSFGLVLLLVMLEPDFGTASVIGFISILIYFASGAPIWHFLSLVPVGIVGLLAILLSPYRKQRLLTFLDPSSDPLGSSYHIRQIMLALGSGGLFGVGLGQSRQKYLFLPEPATDSIFAIIGEELGFVGGVIVMFAFAYFIWRGLLIAMRAKDPFARLLAVGITSWIGIQAVVNLCAMVALVPLTGVPLPFLSYGGSALVVNLTAVGVLLNISKEES